MISNIIPFRPLRPTPVSRLEAHLRFWAQSLDRLNAYIVKLQAEERAQMSDIRFDYPKDDPVIICTRSFDAPVSLVWTVFTTPEHVVRWWGPQSYAPIKSIEKLELRKGGQWRFICEHRRGGTPIVFYGTYVDVVPEQRLANSFGVEGQFPANEDFPEVHTFEERDGRTYYKSVGRMPSLEARDAIVATGMEMGGRESLEQLGNLIDELQRQMA